MRRGNSRDRWIYHGLKNNIWRIFIGPTSTTALNSDDTDKIIIKLKPVLDLVEPVEHGHGDWVLWVFSEEEYESLMEGGDESTNQCVG